MMQLTKKRKRHEFRPTLMNANLEERQVLSGGAIPATPAPAPPPVSMAKIRLETAQIRATYIKQFQAASTALKTAIKADINQLYANGSDPTTQQMADYNAEVAGAINATALRLSSQASLLPNSSNKLIPAIQNSLLGTLATRLTAISQSSTATASAKTLQTAVTSQLNRTAAQSVSQITSYFNTTPVNRVSVDSSGQRIPLEEYIGDQIISQTADNFGSLAASYPIVANAILYGDSGVTPTTTTGSVTVAPTPTQQLFDQFGVQARNALSTAAYQVSSDLAVIPGSAAITPAIQSALFGSSPTSLSSELATLPYGSTNFNSAVATTFNTAFQNVATPISSYLKMTDVSTTALPTSGLTSPFISSYDTGFNDGFATGTSAGYIGFGVAPTTYDTNYGTSFSTLVTNLNTTTGLLGTVTTEGGTPVESR